MPSTPQSSGPQDAVVLAWEAPVGADDGTRLAALDALAAQARELDAALLVPIDAGSERRWTSIVAMLSRHGVKVLPAVTVDDPGTAAAAPAAMLAALVASGGLAEWEGARWLVIASEPGALYRGAPAALAAALGAPSRPVRVGWLRRRYLHAALPADVQFLVDCPPYSAQVAPGQATSTVPSTFAGVDYTILATDLARLHAGDSAVAPSVLWSRAASHALPGIGAEVTGIAPIKIAHAIDSARRFVRNRAGHGVPFWVLRAAFDPGHADTTEALRALAAAVSGLHPASAARSPLAPIDVPADSAARIAVVVHLYYLELWGQFAAAIAMLPEPCDVFVSCPLRARDAVARIVQASFPAAVVFGTRNLGRDVLPFLHWFRAPGIGRYEYVLKLHSKKSVHAVDASQAPFGGGEGWRRRAIDGLIGADGHAAALLRMLDARPDVGLVAPAGLLSDQFEWKCATGDILATLRARLGLKKPVGGRFPAGTMFWARIAALSPLASLPDDLMDFECEAGQVDGTLHHSYERLFALVAAERGFGTIDSGQLVA
jgi:hypothetical protein